MSSITPCASQTLSAITSWGRGLTLARQTRGNAGPRQPRAAACRVHQDICRLDVPMDKAMLMHMVERPPREGSRCAGNAIRPMAGQAGDRLAYRWDPQAPAPRLCGRRVRKQRILALRAICLRRVAPRAGAPIVTDNRYYNTRSTSEKRTSGRIACSSICLLSASLNFLRRTFRAGGIVGRKL
jgi:hypothetical protein